MPSVSFSPLRLILAVGVIALILLLPLLVATGVYLSYSNSDRLFPSITVGQVGIGGLSEQQASDRLNIYWNHDHRITAGDGQHVWTFAPIDLGLWMDAKATTAQAFSLGRGAAGWQTIPAMLSGTTQNVLPVVAFGSSVARDRLIKLAAELRVQPVNASLRKEKNTWVGIPGKNGLELNIDATLQQAAANPTQIMLNGSFPLLMREVPPAIADPNDLLQRLNHLLDHPLRLQAYDPLTDQSITWDAPRDDLQSWLILKNSGDNLDFDLDSAQVNAYLQTWQAEKLPAGQSLQPFVSPPVFTSLWLSGDPLVMIIRHAPTKYTITGFDSLRSIAIKVGIPYWKIQSANPTLDPSGLTPGETLTIPSADEMLPLPLVRSKRIVINLTEQRLRAYENGKLHAEMTISSGIASSPTLHGVFQVLVHHPEAEAPAWNLHLPSFLGIYENWPGFMNGIHGLPDGDSASPWWQNSLGSPATQGSILLNTADAQSLYAWADDGVIVEIQP